MSIITDQPIHITIHEVCECDAFKAIYDERGRCCKCGKPRPVVVKPEDVCEVCGGKGDCNYCSWGCQR